MASAYAKVPNQAESPPQDPYYLRMPSELLLEIFIRICDPPKSLDLPLSSKEVTLPGPFLLGKICRHWRQLVFSSPPLWAYIHLDPPLMALTKRGVIVDLLDEYLRRSADLPLTIRLVVRRNHLLARALIRVSKTGNPYYPLYKLLLQQCHRWEAIGILDSSSLVEYMEYRHGSIPHLPLLRSASFAASLMQGGLEINLIQNSSQLRSLSLTSMKLPLGGPPYHRLTRLTVSELAHAEVLNILRDTPNLRTCVLVDIYQSFWPASAAPRIALKRLESLTVRHCEGLDNLFEGITSTPVLREFKCTSDSDRDPPLRRAKLFHGRKVETLQVGAGSRVLRGVVALLEALLRQSEELTCLILRLGSDREVPENVATILNPLWPPPSSMGTSIFGSFQDYERQSPVICPNLQHLEMEFSGGSVLPILQVLKNRWLFRTVDTPDSSLIPYGGQNFVKIASARLPERCRAQVMLQLGEEIKEGLVVDFFPETPEDKLFSLIRDEEWYIRIGSCK